jgi:esterase/lipase superfamily enzyme
MDLLCYGHYGQPLLVFPSATGRHHEWEDFKMIETLAWFIDAGKIKLYCPDSVNEESWFNYGAPPGWRAERHTHYCRYITDELLPFVRADCRNPGAQVVGTGASFGAYQALNCALKYPWLFRGLICMSGVYDVRERVVGYYDDNVYFNNPFDYLPALSDGGLLDQIRRLKIALVVGQGAWEGNCIPQTVAMSELLNSKSIPHHLSLWGQEWAHDWPTWRAMIHYYVSIMD